MSGWSVSTEPLWHNHTAYTNYMFSQSNRPLEPCMYCMHPCVTSIDWTILILFPALLTICMPYIPTTPGAWWWVGGDLISTPAWYPMGHKYVHHPPKYPLQRVFFFHEERWPNHVLAPSGRRFWLIDTKHPMYAYHRRAHLVYWCNCELALITFLVIQVPDTCMYIQVSK